MTKFATLAVFTCLAAAPVLADNDKHRSDNQRYTYGSIVSSCNQRANELRLRGQERREFVARCTRRGNQYFAHNWDRVHYDRDRSRHCDDDRRYWDDVRYREDEDYRGDDRDRRDWRYAALEDFIRQGFARD